MAQTFTDARGRTIVQRFISSGKPGFCELCNKRVEKLEAHHVKYQPEATINLCHNCHHKTHFWPRRLSEKEKFKILSKVHTTAVAHQLSQFKFSDVSNLAKLIAPSRKAFIHQAQQLDEAARKEPETKNRKISDTHKRIQHIPRLKDKKKTI